MSECNALAEHAARAPLKGLVEDENFRWADRTPNPMVLLDLNAPVYKKWAGRRRR